MKDKIFNYFLLILFVIFISVLLYLLYVIISDPYRQFEFSLSKDIDGIKLFWNSFNIPIYLIGGSVPVWTLLFRIKLHLYSKAQYEIESIKKQNDNTDNIQNKQNESLISNELTRNSINLETIGNIAWHWAKNNLGMVDVDTTPYCTDCRKRMIHDRQGFKYKCPDCNNIIHSGQRFVDSRNAAVKYITEKYENL